MQTPLESFCEIICPLNIFHTTDMDVLWMVDPSTSPTLSSSSSYQSLYTQVLYAKVMSHSSHMPLSI
jgi:hypothetical protein